jgi:hypothetical protein
MPRKIGPDDRIVVGGKSATVAQYLERKGGDRQQALRGLLGVINSGKARVEWDESEHPRDHVGKFTFKPDEQKEIDFGDGGRSIDPADYVAEARQLTQAEQDSLVEYQTSGYHQINGYLRGDPEHATPDKALKRELETHIKRIDEAMRASRLARGGSHRQGRRETYRGRAPD